MLESEWRALHIFLNDTNAVELFLRQEIAPRIGRSDCGHSGWFFIRYWEGGQHIRLRLRNMPGVAFASLADELRTAAAQYRVAQPLDRQTYLAGLSAELRATAITDSKDFYEDGSVAEFPYEPEFLRYGGPIAIAAHERLFVSSSAIALKLIAQTAERPQHRLALSRSLMLAGAAALLSEPNALHEFFKDYAKFWQKLAGPALPDLAALATAGAASAASANAQLAALHSDEPTVAHVWHRRCKMLVDELTAMAAAGTLTTHSASAAAQDPVASAIQSMLGSQLHMLNNRLGMGPVNEYALASMLAASFA